MPFTFLNRITGLIILVMIVAGAGMSQIAGPSSEDKSVVYFLRGFIDVRLDAATFNRTPPTNVYVTPDVVFPIGNNEWSMMRGIYIYDSTTIVAELFESEYMRYECDSGYHLFWSTGTPNEYLEAELLPGKVYFIDVSVKTGEKSADFRTVNPDNEFWIDGIRSFVSEQDSKCYSEKSLQKEQKRKRKKITKGLARMQEDKDRGKRIGKLEKGMYYRPPQKYKFELK